MERRQYRKLIAFGLSCSIMAAGIPQLPSLNQEFTEAAQSVQGFMAQLAAMQQSKEQSEPFAQLRYDKKEKTLYRDGIEVGKEFAGFAVSENRLVLRVDAASEGKTQERVLTLEEASKQIGCEVQEDADGITVTSPFANGRLIVKSKGTVDRKNAIDVVENFRDLHVLQFATAADAYAAYLEYLEDENVIFTEPSRTAHIAEKAENPASYKEVYEQIISGAQNQSTDPAKASWGYEAIGAGQYNEWLTANYETLPEITVAVIDTGLNYEHTWFENRIADGGAMLMSDSSYDGKPVDDNGHGTHCAGIICSVTTENVKIMPIKVLDFLGYGDILNIYCGMLYALEQKADVISMSLGINGDSPLVNEAADLIAAADIPCCVAAGNDSMNAEFFSPARHEASITVAATDQDQEPASFTNYGDKIDFAAPGVEINSAAHESTDGLVTMSGTSMATPYVAGCCAMLLSTDANMTTDTLYGYLKANATDCGESGWDTTYGWGIVQMADFRFTDIVCAKPMVDYGGGNYEEEITIRLFTPTENAKIYYTMDGTVPDRETGILYQEPLLIAQSVCLKAVAYYDDYASTVITENYVLYNEDVVDPFVVDSKGTLVAYRGVLTELNLTELKFKVPLTAIGEGAFENRKDLYSVELPTTVTSIGKRAFANCRNLESVTCEGVTVVGEEAFKDASMLIQLFTAPLTEIHTGSFDGCCALEKVELADTLTEIPARAFRDCYSLTTVSLPNVTVVGESAWQFCSMLQLEAVDWNSMTAIGDRAFSNCIELKDDVTLPLVETLGEYAFESSGITGITLPEQLTVIPKGLLLDCSMLERISAPGVTKIEDYGLAVGSSFTGTVLDSDLDYANITEIGEGGMVGFYFKKPVEFSSLTNMGAGAFGMTAGATLSLPLVETAESESFALVLTNALYLESLKTMESAAFMACGPVVVGDQCTEIAADAMAACDVLAGPAGSEAELYALKNGMDFYPTPTLMTVETDYVWQAFAECPITLVPLAFDVQCQWYQYDPETETATAIADGIAFDYEPEIPEDTVAWYRVEMLDAQDKVLDTVEFSVKREAFVVDGVLKEDEYFFWDYEAMREKAAAIEQQGLELLLTEIEQHLSFTPTEDGTYYFYNLSDGGVLHLIISENGKPIESCRYDTFGLEPVLIVDLTAGTEYVITNTVLTGSDFVAATVVSQINPNDCLSFIDVQCDEWTEKSFDQIYPFKPEFTFFDWNVEKDLVEGEDYILVMENNDKPGIMFTYAFGIGDYRGRSNQYATVLADTAKMDTLLPVVISDSMDYIYLFTPEVSGDYRIFSCPAETTFLKDNESEWYDVDTALQIQDEKDAVIYDADDTMESLCFDTTVFLEAGVQYQLCCSSFGSSFYQSLNSEYELYITQEKEPLKTYAIKTESKGYEYNGTPVIPDDITVYDANDELLTENVDYTLEFYHNDGIGAMCIVATGMGSYLGRTFTSRLIRPGDFNENAIAIEPEVPFEQQGEDAVYVLTIEEEGEYYLDSVKYKDLRVSVNLYQKDSMETIELSSGAVWLQAGTYYLIIPSDCCEGPLIVCRYYDIADADITVDNLTYTGKPQVPHVVVTMGDTVLEENKDYVLGGDIKATNCGIYELIIGGIGAYDGDYYVNYYVLPELSPTEQYLTDGDHTIEITEPGAMQAYSWVPEHSGQYCISNSDIKNVIIFVFDDAGELITEVSGLHESYMYCSVQAGKSYYVSVGFGNSEEYGACHIQLAYGRKTLMEAAATVDYEYYIPDSQKDTIPEVLLLDANGEALKEGVDYELVTVGNRGSVGLACMYLQGIGAYVGTLDIPYVVYYEDLLALLEDRETATDMEYEVEVTIDALHPNYAEVYRYTADKEGTYALQIDDTVGAAVIPYDQNGRLIADFDTSSFELSEGESIYFYCAIPGIHVDFQGYCTITITEKQITEYYEYNGVTYEIHNDYAEVIALDPTYYGYEILDSVVHPMTELSVDVMYIDDLMLENTVDHQKLFFTSEDSAVGRQLIFLEYHVIFKEAESEVLGDVSGDGILDEIDYQYLVYFITECKGIYMKSTQIPSADLNKDGLIDLSDAQALLEIMTADVFG